MFFIGLILVFMSTVHIQKIDKYHGLTTLIKKITTFSSIIYPYVKVCFCNSFFLKWLIKTAYVFG